MATLARMTELHSARLRALDNWAAVRSAMAAPTDRLAAIAQELGVSELGALSVLAMANGPLPARRYVEEQLRSLEYLRDLVDKGR